MSDTKLIALLTTISKRLDSIEQKLAGSDDDLLNISQAAAELGKTKNAIRQMVCRGQLNAEHAPNGQLRFRMGHIKEMRNQTRNQ